MTPLKLAFIGAGRMAGAMVRGILAHGIARPEDITCLSAPDGTAEKLAAAYGIRRTDDHAALLKEADWMILACKPQQLAELPAELSELTSGTGVLSILAGTPLTKLKERFPSARHLVRCMPNTPGQIGAGITAFCTEAQLPPGESENVARLLGALGEVVELPETELDAVTAVSGSGPAYVFTFIAALRDAGVEAGLSRETAYRLALHTVKGAATLLEKVPESPETHRDWVSSPGGTTLAGLEVLDRGGLPALMRDTVLAAQRRSRELAGE